MVTIVVRRKKTSLRAPSHPSIHLVSSSIFRRNGHGVAFFSLFLSRLKRVKRPPLLIAQARPVLQNSLSRVPKYKPKRPLYIVHSVAVDLIFALGHLVIFRLSLMFKQVQAHIASHVPLQEYTGVPVNHL